MSEYHHRSGAYCGICGAHLPARLLASHMEDAHEITLEIETWPDGEPVIVDETLEPAEFVPPTGGDNMSNYVGRFQLFKLLSRAVAEGEPWRHKLVVKIEGPCKDDCVWCKAKQVLHGIGRA